MRNKFLFLDKLILTLNILFISCLAYADPQQPVQPLKSLTINVTPKLPRQSMLYGPLDANNLYNLTCQIDKSNTDKKIEISICHDGNADDDNICGKDSKKISIKLNKEHPTNVFTFKNLKPITLNKKWSDGLSTKYIIMLSVKSVTPFEKDEYLSGSCDIQEQVK